MEQENQGVVNNQATTTDVDEVKAIIDSIKQYSSELGDIKQEILNKKKAVLQSSTNVSNKEAEVITFHNSIQELEQKAKKYIDQIEEENTKLSKYLDNFNAIRTKLDDESDGLEAVNTWVQQQKEEVGKLLGQTRVDQAEISKIKDASVTAKKEIIEFKKEIEGYREEVEKTYGFMTGQGLSHSFSERQKGLIWPVIIWGIILIVSASIVMIFLAWIFHDLPKDGNGSRIFDGINIWTKISFIWPAFVVFGVALRQYSRERRLLESYAFKAATAKALENYTDILANRFSEKEFKRDIMNFVLHAMHSIYRHPNNEMKKVDDNDELPSIMNDVGGFVGGAAKKALEPINKVVNDLSDNK